MSISNFANLQSIARALGGELNGNEVLAPGPGHSPTDRSLSIALDANAPDGFIVHSFAGDDAIRCKDYVRERAGIPAFKPNGRRKPVFNISKVIAAESAAAPKGNIVKAYDYTDEHGELLYQVCRLEPKSFRQRRPNGNGGWTWDVGEQRVLYRLPELLKYPDATVFLTEGEKDADRIAALGYTATTVASGKWTPACIQALAGRDVLIFEDNDDAGRQRAREAAEALYEKAKTIRIVRLPGLADKDDVLRQTGSTPIRATTPRIG